MPTLTTWGTTDPNAPLSTLLPSAPTQYANTTKPGTAAPAKLGYLADIMGTESTKNLQAGTSLLEKPLDYWEKILKPPTRGELLEQTAPAVSSVIGQYATGRKALGQLPRGGGATAGLANLPFQEAGDITKLLEDQLAQRLNVLQPEAAQAITGISTLLSSLGLEEAGLSAQTLQATISAAMERGKQNAAALGGLGKAIGTIAGAMLIASGAGAPAGAALIAGSNA